VEAVHARLQQRDLVAVGQVLEAHPAHVASSCHPSALRYVHTSGRPIPTTAEAGVIDHARGAAATGPRQKGQVAWTRMQSPTHAAWK